MHYLTYYRYLKQPQTGLGKSDLSNVNKSMEMTMLRVEDILMVYFLNGF